MTKENYHHGDLKRELIKKGLQLLNKEGYDAFSLRKVAKICDVSHAAPYKHFKNKEELIMAITMDAVANFTATIKEVIDKNSGDYKNQVIELGKQYIKFMVENPDYFRFIFLTDHSNPIMIKDGNFILSENWPFTAAKNSVLNYLSSVGNTNENQDMKFLTFWSAIHGLTVLLINRTIKFEGDYLEFAGNVVEKIVKYSS